MAGRLGLLVLISLGLILLISVSVRRVDAPTQNIQTTPEPEIVLDYPQPNDVVTSPLVIKGKAKGTWFFEGDFPVTLYYGVKSDFVDTYATAKGEWMTTEYVEFEATINFPVPPTNDGLLVLIKDNPSDMRELDKSFSVKVRFHDD